MKVAVLFAVAFCLVACFMAQSLAVPAAEAESGLDALNGIEPEHHGRYKRATCDLLSYGGIINHSACAAHCILLGKRGGYCNSRAVCVCRN